MCAAAKGHDQVVKILLSKDAKVNTPNIVSKVSVEYVFSFCFSS